MALVESGILGEVASVEQCWGAPSRQCIDYLATLAGHKIAGQVVRLEDISTPELHRLYCASIVRSAIYKGTDVRLASGIMTNPAVWPALLLASCCHPFHVYVRSELKPADAPSREW